MARRRVNTWSPPTPTSNRPSSPIDAKTNEHKAALELLGILSVRGKVILGDAMFCQRDLCATIVAQGGDSLFTVKGNQLGWEQDIASGFGFEAGARQIAAAFSP